MIDHASVSVVVLDMFRVAGMRPIAVTIHRGDKVSREGRAYRVTRRDLVGVLQILLQNGWL